MTSQILKLWFDDWEKDLAVLGFDEISENGNPQIMNNQFMRILRVYELALH